jgi:hypothetical protein
MFLATKLEAKKSLSVTLATVTALAFCAPVRGEDEKTEVSKTGASKTAAQSPTLARILASWNARQARMKSFQFVWDTYQVPGHEPLDTRRQPRVSHNALTRDGGDRYRSEVLLLPLSRPLARRPGREGYNSRAFDGKTYSTLKRSRYGYERAHGMIGPMQRPPMTPLGQNLALMMFFCPFQPETGWRPEQFRLIAENAIAEGVHCVKLQRSDARTGQEETFWVDPNRDDVIVLWEGSAGWPTSVSLQYKMDKEYGWIPTRWRSEVLGGHELVANVERFAINERVPADNYRLRFPPGTAVTAALDSTAQEQYIVGPDGSKRGAVKVVFDEKNRRQYLVAADGSNIELFNLGAIRSERLLNALEAKTDFTIELEPLRDAIKFIALRFRLPIAIDKRAFQDAGIEPSMEVKVDVPETKLWKLIATLMAQCPRPLRIEERDGRLVITPLVQSKPAAPGKSQPPSK